jgi:anti-sigma regulatory factor (Ser/Thr protein kinase)
VRRGWARAATGYIHTMPASTGGLRTARVETHGPHGLRMRLGSGPDAAAEARQAIAALRADLDPPLMETLRLLVTELVTNSVRHTQCDSLTLRVAVGQAAVLTEVADEGPGFDADAAVEAEQAPDRDANGGWGLFLVERLARDWGVTEDHESKRVWFELARA